MEDLSGIRGFLDETYPFVKYTFILFLASIIAGVIGYPFFEDMLPGFLNRVFSGVLVEGEFWLTVFNVLFRNVTTTIVLLVLGVLILPSLLIIGGNGFLIGLVARYTVEKGMHPVRVFAAIIPHGVFEIPALLIATGCGLKIGDSLINPGDESRVKSVSGSVKKASKVYLLVVFPLLVIAALIEIALSKNLVG